jgi:hypothetical protein
MPQNGFFYNLTFLTKLFHIVDGKVRLEIDENGTMLVKTTNEFYLQAAVRYVAQKKALTKKSSVKSTAKTEEAA